MLVSCKTKEEDVIGKLDRLAERIDKNGSRFDADDWEEAIEELADIHEEMEDCDFTREQLLEFGRKEGQLTVILAKEGSKALGNAFFDFIGNFGAFTRGFVEGAESAYDKEEFEQIGRDFDQKMNNLKDDWEVNAHAVSNFLSTVDTAPTDSLHSNDDPCYICLGDGATAYHLNRNCNGLNQCHGDIVSTNVGRAISIYHRDACGLCAQ